MKRFRHVYACLVHENPDCVTDLVRNLRALDPDSPILLYNGGGNPGLLSACSLQACDAIAHPQPQRMKWGTLHGFAVDCLRYALEHLSADLITIVDSDQLALRAGYAEMLEGFFAENATCGLLGSTAVPHGRHSSIGPVQAAWREFELWKPFLRKFSDGESRFAHWTFWPSTVFAKDAAKVLVRLFDTDEELARILRQSKLWATEEVLFPTLTALAGFAIRENPASYEYVRFRERYSVAQIDRAFEQRSAFWVHPVPRTWNDPLRAHIRNRLGGYQEQASTRGEMGTKDAMADVSVLLPLQVIQRARAVEGWLEDAEAELLIGSATLAATRHGSEAAFVEIGSFCGKATTVIGSVLQSLAPGQVLYAIDPHDGVVGARDTGLQHLGPTLEKFRRNIERAGVTPAVETIHARPVDVAWSRRIRFLLIDGLHDYESAAADLAHFEDHLVEDACVLFHDYAEYYPGVRRLVDELISSGRYRRLAQAGTMVLLSKAGLHAVGLAAPAAHTHSTDSPLVSCLMPTCNRRTLVPKAIDYFLRQDYPNRELIVMDDGSDSVEHLIPSHPAIRYIRLNQRRSMGAKHNMCCDAAKGEIILHWDDDDWMSPQRISYQVQQLNAMGGPGLSGLSRLLFYEPCTRRAWEYVYPASQTPWVAGGTFCYRKELWQQKRFEDISEGADTRFVWGLRDVPVRPLEDNRFYIATVHKTNTSPKRLADPRWRPMQTDRISTLR